MCLIIFSFKQNSNYPLIIAANRDEFYKRETKTLDIWNEKKGIIAGKDLESGGTWMGVNRLNNKFAAITNYRDPSRMKSDAKSRGFITTSFLESDISVDDFISELRIEKDSYNGFNFLFGTSTSLFHYSNINDKLTEIEPGTHGLSNHLLDTPWPKVEKAKAMLDDSISSGDIKLNAFKFLNDGSPFPDNSLPDTGMGIEWERILSPVFITSEVYGTRSSSLVTFDRENNIEFTEVAYLDKDLIKETSFKIKS